MKNPRANLVGEQDHHMMAEMIQTNSLRRDDWDLEIESALQTLVWEIRTAIRTGTQYSPGQLTFGRDMIFNFPIASNWGRIHATRKITIQKYNKCENQG